MKNVTICKYWGINFTIFEHPWQFTLIVNISMFCIRWWHIYICLLLFKKSHVVIERFFSLERVITFDYDYFFIIYREIANFCPMGQIHFPSLCETVLSLYINVGNCLNHYPTLPTDSKSSSYNVCKNRCIGLTST